MEWADKAKGKARGWPVVCERRSHHHRRRRAVLIALNAGNEDKNLSSRALASKRA